MKYTTVTIFIDYWHVSRKKTSPKYVETLDAVMKCNDIVHQSEGLKVWEMDTAQPLCTQVNLVNKDRSVKQLNYDTNDSPDVVILRI